MSAIEVTQSEGLAKLTQKQIADQLGVSRQLVGFALRGEGRMSDEIRRQILEVAQRNGYHQYSNREARAMVSRRYGKRAASGIIAVLFEATFEGKPLANVPFFMPFFEGMEAEARQRGIDLSLCPLRPNELPRLVRDGQVDGAIGLLTKELVAHQISDLDLPLVNVLYKVPDLPSLIIDNSEGMALATRHLLSQGHRRIAYLGVGGHLADGGPTGRQRAAGYIQALQEWGVPYSDELCDTSLDDPTLADGRAATRRMLNKFGDKPSHSSSAHAPPFTGLVCFNDLIAMGAIRELEAAGWKVPEEVSVVGFDDVSLEYSFHPELTSIRFPRHAMGRRAVQLLCESQMERSKETPYCESFPVELVERHSTTVYSEHNT